MMDALALRGDEGRSRLR